MKIRSSFLFACMAISVVLGGASSASATSTNTDDDTALCRTSQNIDKPANYRWFLLDGEVFNKHGCGYFENSGFMTKCQDSEDFEDDFPAYAEVCKAQLTPMIITTDVVQAQIDRGFPDLENYTCLIHSLVTDQINIQPNCYTTTSEVRDSLLGSPY